VDNDVGDDDTGVARKPNLRALKGLSLRGDGRETGRRGSQRLEVAEPPAEQLLLGRGAEIPPLLTKAVALDYAAQGIRANAVCPAFVDTPLNVPHYNKLGGRQALEDALPDWQPIGRPIEPVEIGQSVAFLLSDASRAITGTSFLVDGGVLCKA
jgi:hypothetical protein